MAVVWTMSSADQNKLNGMHVLVNGVRILAGGVANSGDLIEIKPSAAGWLMMSASFTVNGVVVPFISEKKTRELLTFQAGDDLLTNFQFVYSNVGTSMFMTYTADILADIAAKGCKMYRNNELVETDWQTRSKDVMKLVCDPSVNIGAVAPFWQTSSGTQYPMTVNAARTEGTRTLSGTNITWVSFTLDTVQAGPPPVWTVTQADLTKFTDNMAYLFKGDVRATIGTQFYNGDTVKVTPDRELRQLVNTWLNSTDAAGAYERLSLVQNADKSAATYTFTSDRPVTSFIVTTEARPVRYTVTSADMTRYTNGQATLKINGVAAAVGATIGVGDSLVATANSGRVFYADSVYNITRSGGRQIYAQNEDFTVASLIVGSDGVSGLYVDTVLAPSPDVRGYNNVYELSETQLKAVTQKRWEVNTAGDVVDYGKFFIGLISLPFAINPDYVIGDQDVRLGPLDTDIPAKLLDRDIVRLDVGTIRVVSEKGNLLDYKNTVAMLYLPYTDPVAIDLEYVIDQEIAIEYVISLYDGMATINIMSSKIDNIVLSINVDMGITIPFANVDQAPSKNSPLSIKVGFENGIKVPFIEIMRNETILSDGFFTIPIVDEGLLSAASGYVKVEEIQLNCAATKREKELIISLLKSGVVL